MTAPIRAVNAQGEMLTPKGVRYLRIRRMYAKKMAKRLEESGELEDLKNCFLAIATAITLRLKNHGSE